jgi:cytochrome b pre-mRNA-processing protein 3
LAEVLRRNAYGGRPPDDTETVARLEAYVRAEVDRLGRTVRNHLTEY